MLNFFVYLSTFFPYISLSALSLLRPLPSLLVPVHGLMGDLFIFDLVFEMSCDFLLFIHDTVMNE